MIPALLLRTRHHSRPRLLALTGVLAAGALLSGCAHTHRFQVMAFKNPDLVVDDAAPTYRLVEVAPSDATSLTELPSLAPIIDPMLTERGFSPAGDGIAPDLVIEVAASLEGSREAPRLVPDVMSPRTPGEAATGEILEYHLHAIARRPMRLELVTVFRKRLHLAAYTGSEAGPRTQLWSVTVLHEDPVADLERYLPLMANAAARHVATDTGELRTVRVTGRAEPWRPARERRELARR